MKNIEMSQKSGQKNIEKCKKSNQKYIEKLVTEAGQTVYNGDLDFRDQGISELPFKVDVVNGNLDLTNNKFLTLGDNFPHKVKGDLVIVGNPSTSKLMGEILSKRISITGKIIWL